MKVSHFKIAIVGLGPKGLYGLERILAHLKSNSISQKVEIHIFNKTKFMGSGDVYRSDQPDYLLMNFANQHINMWTKDDPSPVIEQPLSLSQFLAKGKQLNLEEINPLFSSRSIVGAYLENGFQQLCENLPENVVLKQHISVVNSITKLGTSYSIGFKKAGETRTLSDFQNILLSTGHQRHTNPITNLSEVSFIYPVKEKLKCISAEHAVIIKGLGLTFIDAVLALTEGRGGKFVKNDDGLLTYRKSGREPKCIYPFSKSGWPMIPKYNFNLPEKRELYVNQLRSKASSRLNFGKDILPLIEQDMKMAYYGILCHHENEAIEFNPDFTKVDLQVEQFHEKHPHHARFSMKSILNPEFNPKKSTHQNILEYLKDFTTDKAHNTATQAQLTAAAVWRNISPLFNEIYSFSGLEPESQREFDEHYFGKFNRIAYGPPPVNLKKILAVAEAGIINFQFATSPQISVYSNGFTLTINTSMVWGDVLIDARIPKNAIDKEISGLYTNLCENRLARPYFNRGKHSSYETGTIEINKSGNVINAKGNPESIALYGTPTEGIVHDNDTLSRYRNNFAESWANSIINQLINSENDIKQETTSAFSHSS